jgi:phosphoenolpyruvate-protein kinase (PTS system EI component)
MASFTLHGIPVSRGIAIGRAHLLTPAALDVKHYLVAEEAGRGRGARLQDALAQVHRGAAGAVDATCRRTPRPNWAPSSTCTR